MLMLSLKKIFKNWESKKKVATYGARTRDLKLGKLALYQLS